MIMVIFGHINKLKESQLQARKCTSKLTAKFNNYIINLPHLFLTQNNLFSEKESFTLLTFDELLELLQHVICSIPTNQV